MADTKTKITTSTKTTTYPPPPRKILHVLRVVAYNVLFTFIGLGFIALAGEGYLRLKAAILASSSSWHLHWVPWHTHSPLHFVPKVGLMVKPNVEVRWTNHSDFWTISRTNSLGFLDREPINPERAAESCHIAMIGDSFVEAREVPIADKFHVRLEALAAPHMPHLDITTSAFGKGNTGQIAQLPLYDEFARHLSPELVVLVFVHNDFRENSPILSALGRGVHPDRQPFVTAVRDEDGTMRLRPPHPDWQRLRLPQLHYRRVVIDQGWSYFVRELHNNLITLHNNLTTWFPSYGDSQRIAYMKLLSEHPAYKSLFNGWQPETLEENQHRFNRKPLLPSFEKGLGFTAFALDQFVERTERDGVALVILASYTMGGQGHARFDHMSALAEARGIPVIDQYDYIRRQGADPEKDARWTNDRHWNVAGHQWAAEALLEYLSENPQVCTRPADTGTP